jgi:hypothetical protein
MKVMILAVIVAVISINTLALCKAAKRGDERLEYPERIQIRGNR